MSIKFSFHVIGQWFQILHQNSFIKWIAARKYYRFMCSHRYGKYQSIVYSYSQCPIQHVYNIVDYPLNQVYLVVGLLDELPFLPHTFSVVFKSWRILSTIKRYSRDFWIVLGCLVPLLYIMFIYVKSRTFSTMNNKNS